MAAATDFSSPTFRAPLTLPISALQNASLWLLVFSGFLAIIEPSPYEVMFVITGLVFLATGFRFARAMVPLLIGLLAFNIGGVISLVPFFNDRDAVVFIAISFYLATTCLFFAGAMLSDTKQRIETIQSGWTAAAVIASIAGLMGYFNLLDTAAIFTKFGRATGTFKDPNVFGPFIAGPAVMLAQGFLVGGLKRPIWSLTAFLIIVAGIFFSFSRGAWGVAVFSIVLTGLLLLITTRSGKLRSRIIFSGIAGVVLLAALLAVILSTESTRALFDQRFALAQDYDVGAQGRFGKLGSAITLLLERPNGLGPLQFDRFFPEAPHNVYVAAFSGYGWLGGLSYAALMFVTLWIGWSAVWKRTPWQPLYIGVWSMTFFQIVQGLQIDSDHWRHFWMLIGMSWGIAIASFRHAWAHPPSR
jgi:O-antigen ligase